MNRLLCAIAGFLLLAPELRAQNDSSAAGGVEFRVIWPINTAGASRVPVQRIPLPRSSGAVGALIGGATGITAGLLIGHAAPVGCRLADTHCNPANKQVKAMIGSAIILGAVGAGVGYLAGKFLLDNTAAQADPRGDGTSLARAQRARTNRIPRARPAPTVNAVTAPLTSFSSVSKYGPTRSMFATSG